MRARYASIAAHYLLAVAGVVLVSVVIGAVLSLAQIANLSTLYLIVVLAAATRLGRGPAIAASIAAFLAYDWFFIEPKHTLTIADPGEWVSLFIFLVTAIIASELAANERARALTAGRREREATLLYEALRLMGEPDLDAALRAVAERVRAELAVPAVVVELTVAGRRSIVSVGDADAVASVTEVLGAGRTGGRTGRWIRVMPPSRPARIVHVRKDARRFEVAIRWKERVLC
jgi:two-component system sensor histidine kinase KdpD